MSKIVLCETKPAKTAYTIHKINRSFQSYEELCWLLEHYLIFFLSEGIDRSLKNYLKEYLNLEIKSEDAVQQVKEIINFQNYFTAEDKDNLLIFRCKETKASGRYVPETSFISDGTNILSEIRDGLRKIKSK